MVWVLIIYLVVPVQYFTGDLSGLDVDTMGAPNPLARALKLGLLALSTVVVLWRARLAWHELRWLNPFFIVFLVLVPLSALWSIDASATVNRFVSVLSIVDVCFAFTLLGWNRTRFQDVLRPVITSLLVASVIWRVIYPQYAIESGEGTLLNSWRGLTSQKNQFGMLASFGVLFWLHAWFNKENGGSPRRSSGCASSRCCCRAVPPRCWRPRCRRS